MFATFLALGYTSSEVEHMFRTTNFKAFKDAKKGVWAKMENLYPSSSLLFANFFFCLSPPSILYSYRLSLFSFSF